MTLAEYGLVSFCLSYLLAIDALLGAAIDLGIARQTTAHKLGPPIHRLEKAGIVWKICIGAAVLLSLSLTGEYIGERFFSNRNAAATLQLWAAAATVMLLIRSLQFYFQSRHMFRAYGLTDFSHTVLRLSLLGAAVSAKGATPSLVMVCYLAAGGLILTLAICVLWRGAAWSAHPATVQDLNRVWVEAKPAMASSGLGIVITRMDLFFLAALTDPASLAFYSAALTVAMIPEIVASYVSPVFLPRIQPACADGTIGHTLHRINRAVYWVCGAGLIAGYFLTPPLLAAIAGDRYAPSGALLPVLLAGTVAISTIFPVTLNFLLLRNPRMVFLIDAVALPLLAAVYWFAIPAYGITGAAWAMAAYRCGRAMILQFMAHRIAGQISLEQTA